jgi:hypothetical protein
MSTTKFANPYKGHNETPAGVMPAAMAERHRLSMNIPGEKYERRGHRGDHNFKYGVELLKAYRLKYHGVTEPHLASPLRMALHSLYTPLSRTDSGREMNTDRRLNQSANAEQGDDPRQVPLKV